MVAAKGKTKTDSSLRLVGKFKALSCNAGKSTMGFRVERPESFDVEGLDRIVTGAQLECELVLMPGNSNDIKGQETIDGVDIKVKATADCLGINVRREYVSLSIRMHDETISISDLNKLTGRPGTMELVRVGDASGGDED